MGEAEDAVFARDVREQEARRTADDRRAQELVEQIQSYVPQALKRLRSLGWPEFSHPAMSHPNCRETLRLSGEDRLGWVIYYSWGQEHAILLLGDGTFARRGEATPRIVSFKAGDHISLEEAEGALRGIRLLAGGRPKPAPPVTPPLRTPRVSNIPPPPRPWWKRLLGL